MTITITPELEKAIQEEAARQNKSPEQLAMEALIAGLKNRHVPQSLEELAPRKPLPPGKTIFTGPSRRRRTTPRVAIATADVPVSLASASAMNAAPDSCRVETSESSGCCSTASRISRKLSPGTV